MISREEFIDIEEKMEEFLSDLEWKVLMAYLEGKSYQEIATDLNRHVKSIDNALQRVKRKLERYRSGFIARQSLRRESRAGELDALFRSVYNNDAEKHRAGAGGFCMTCSSYSADVAQLAEQLICNQQVAGSSPIVGSS